MSFLSIEMNKEEYSALQKFAKAKRVSMEEAMKKAFFEMLEDEYDLRVFDEAYAEYIADSKSYSSEEVIIALGL